MVRRKIFNLKNSLFRIIKSSSILKKSINNIIDTQCLFGETFKVINTNGSWSFGVSEVDKYKGWIKSSALGSYMDYNHFISCTRTFIYTKADIKSEIITYLPIRSRVNVIEKKNDWAKLDIRINKKILTGYVINSHILNKDKKIQDWVKYAELFLSTPYRWGGRDSIGIDCSALLQLCKAFSGEKLPRDSSDQFKYFKKSKNYKILSNPHLGDFFRGNIIYWKGHIAIVVNDTDIIHASAFHGMVKLENIKKVLTRINKPFYLVKE
jgi:cell wall-associated NlpC family hydrolase